MFVVPQVVSTYVALSQFSQNVGDKEKWLNREQLAIQKSSLCWFSREGLLATAQLMQALAYTETLPWASSTSPSSWVMGPGAGGPGAF